MSRIDRDQARLDSGAGTSKDLTALQHELVSLNKRRSDLEDVELEVMERLESLPAPGQVQQVRDGLQGWSGWTVRDEELGGIEAEAPRVPAGVRNWPGDFDAGLLAVYEKTLAQRGIGAARLFHGKSEGSGMQLSPGDLADLKQAAADDIVFCPDSGCILVRSAEWA